jgi:hypothetical protein
MDIVDEDLKSIANIGTRIEDIKNITNELIAANEVLIKACKNSNEVMKMQLDTIINETGMKVKEEDK